MSTSWAYLGGNFTSSNPSDMTFLLGDSRPTVFERSFRVQKCFTIIKAETCTKLRPNSLQKTSRGVNPWHFSGYIPGQRNITHAYHMHVIEISVRSVGLRRTDGWALMTSMDTACTSSLMSPGVTRTLSTAAWSVVPGRQNDIAPGNR